MGFGGASVSYGKCKIAGVKLPDLTNGIYILIQYAYLKELLQRRRAFIAQQCSHFLRASCRDRHDVNNRHE